MIRASRGRERERRPRQRKNRRAELNDSVAIRVSMEMNIEAVSKPQEIEVHERVAGFDTQSRSNLPTACHRRLFLGGAQWRRVGATRWDGLCIRHEPRPLPSRCSRLTRWACHRS